MNDILIDVKSENEKKRVDIVVLQNTNGLSRTYIHKLIKDEFITVNGKSVSKNHVLKYGDLVKISLPEPKVVEILPENIPLDIFYEDDDILIVNKIKGMVVHPAPGNYTSTLVNALLGCYGDKLSSINGIIRPGIVHRIDKDTSGLLIVVKNNFSHNFIAEQIKNHSFKREYEAIVHGRILNDRGIIDCPIGRSTSDRKKMCVTEKCSKRAITHYTVIKRYKNHTHVKLSLYTGRTHQIRVHMSHIGHPLLGDVVYGFSKNKDFKLFQGQCLHARILGFVHPKSKKYVEFKSDLPKYFKECIEFLDK